jgi:hypothetical protein
LGFRYKNPLIIKTRSIKGKHNMQNIILIFTALLFLTIGGTAGVMAGHYHGVAVTMQGVMGNQVKLLEDLQR